MLARIGWVVAVWMLAGCSESAGTGALCDDICNWPESCFGELSPALGTPDCLEACDEAVDIVGVGCAEAVNASILCLGTCEESEISVADVERCESLLLQTDSTCQ